MALSSDPDADAVLASFDHPEAAHDSDAAAVLASYDEPRKPKGVFTDRNNQPELIPMLWEGGKEIAQGLVHGAGTLADVATGTAPGPRSHADRWASVIPTDPSMGGQINPEPEITPQQISKTYDKTFGTGPAAQTFKERIPQAVEAIGMVTGIGGLANRVIPRGFGGARIPASTTLTEPALAEGQAVLDKSYSARSGGAASTAPRITALPAEAQQEIRQTSQKTGGIVNPDVLERQAEASEFGVRLTRGQATGDAAQLADEFNTRNENPEFSQRRVETNQKLIEGINGIKDDVAPSAAVDHEANAQTVIDSYKDKYAPIAADASAKWKAFQDAAGGALPLDPGDFTAQVQAALKKAGKSRYLPADVAADLKDIDDGEPFTIERWDNLKTNLAAAQRAAERSGNGNAALAVSAARDAVENYNFRNLDPKLKALNDQARQATALKYAMLKADPAMDAAVHDGVARGKLSPEAKGYMERYFLKANKADLQQATQNLSDSIDAKQAIAGSTLNELKRSAGIDMYRDDGNFSQAGYNNKLNELQPRIGYLLDQATADKAFRLGNVARNAMRQPVGPAFNNSGTSVTAQVAKRIGSGIVNTAESLGNMATGKLKLGTGVREEAAKMAQRAWVRDSLKPFAGLDYVERPK